MESITEFSTDISTENLKETINLPAYSTVYTEFQNHLGAFMKQQWTSFKFLGVVLGYSTNNAV